MSPVADTTQRTGFVIDSYDETVGWKGRVARTSEAILANTSALQSEMGTVAFTSLSLEVTLTLQRAPYGGRVIAVATRS